MGSVGDPPHRRNTKDPARWHTLGGRRGLGVRPPPDSRERSKYRVFRPYLSKPPGARLGQGTWRLERSAGIRWRVGREGGKSGIGAPAGGFDAPARPGVDRLELGG